MAEQPIVVPETPPNVRPTGLMAGRYLPVQSSLSAADYHAIVQNYIRMKADMQVQHQKLETQVVTTYGSVVAGLTAARAKIVQAQASMAQAQATAKGNEQRYLSGILDDYSSGITQIVLGMGDSATLDDFGKYARTAQVSLGGEIIVDEDLTRSLGEAKTQEGVVNAFITSGLLSGHVENLVSQAGGKLSGVTDKYKQYGTAKEMEEVSYKVIESGIARKLQETYPGMDTASLASGIAGRIMQDTVVPQLSGRPGLKGYEGQYNGIAENARKTLTALVDRADELGRVGDPSLLKGVDEAIGAMNDLVKDGPHSFSEKIQGVSPTDSLNRRMAEIDVAIKSLTPDDPLEGARASYMTSVPHMPTIIAALGMQPGTERLDTFMVRNPRVVAQMSLILQENPDLVAPTAEAMGKFRDAIGVRAREQNYNNEVEWPSRFTRIDDPPEYLMAASELGFHDMESLGRAIELQDQGFDFGEQTGRLDAIPRRIVNRYKIERKRQELSRRAEGEFDPGDLAGPFRESVDLDTGEPIGDPPEDLPSDYVSLPPGFTDPDDSQSDENLAELARPGSGAAPSEVERAWDEAQREFAGQAVRFSEDSGYIVFGGGEYHYFVGDDGSVSLVHSPRSRGRQLNVPLHPQSAGWSQVLGEVRSAFKSSGHRPPLGLGTKFAVPDTSAPPVAVADPTPTPTPTPAPTPGGDVVGAEDRPVGWGVLDPDASADTGAPSTDPEAGQAGVGATLAGKVRGKVSDSEEDVDADPDPTPVVGLSPEVASRLKQHPLPPSLKEVYDPFASRRAAMERREKEVALAAERERLKFEEWKAAKAQADQAGAD